MAYIFIGIAAVAIVIGLVIFLMIRGKRQRKNEDMIYPFW